jgi:hypothetical protein
MEHANKYVYINISHHIYHIVSYYIILYYIILSCYNLMEPLFYMQSVVDRNVVMRRMTVNISLSATLLQLFYNELSTFSPLDSSLPYQLLIKVVYLYFRGIASVWSPDEGPSWTETFCNIQCDVI